MKKFFIVIGVFIVLTGVGYYLVNHFIGAGAVGRIKYFDFNFSLQELEKGMNHTVQKNSNIEYVDSDDYFYLVHPKEKYSKNPLFEDFRSQDATFKYLSIQTEHEKYIFRLKTRDMDSISSRITLVSATDYGKGLRLAENIGYFKKRKYSNIFEEQFITKVKREVIK